MDVSGRRSKKETKTPVVKPKHRALGNGPAERICGENSNKSMIVERLVSIPIKNEQLVCDRPIKEEADDLNEKTESGRAASKTNGECQTKKEEDETRSKESPKESTKGSLKESQNESPNKSPNGSPNKSSKGSPKESPKRQALIDYSSNESAGEMCDGQSADGRSSPKIAHEHPNSEATADTAAANKSIVNSYSSEEESNDKHPPDAVGHDVIRVSAASSPPAEKVEVKKVEVKKAPSESPQKEYEFVLQLHPQSDHESLFSQHSSVASTRKSASYAESTSSSRGSSRASSRSSSNHSSRTSSSGSYSSGSESSDQESSMLTDDDDDKSQNSDAASARSIDKASKRRVKRGSTPRSTRESTPASSVSSRRSRRKAKKANKSDRKRSPRRRSRRSRESRRSASCNSTKRLKTGERSRRSRREHRSRSAGPSDANHHTFDLNTQIKDFADLKISQPFLRKLDEMKLREPNDLQKLILPALLDRRVDRNILVQSKPLTGKKLLFLIAALERIDPNLDQSQVFILAPTAELCAHICELADQLCKYTRIRISFLVFDYDSKRKKITDHLVISTMGTMLGCLSYHVLNPSSVRLMIYYGIDCLAASSHDLKRIRQVENALSNECQRLYFSDNFEKQVSGYVRSSINSNLITFNEFTRDDLTRNILQFYVYCHMKDRHSVLNTLLKNTVSNRVVVYVFGLPGVREVAEPLEAAGFHVVALSTRTGVEERMNNIEKFKRCSKGVLVLNYPLTNNVDLGTDISMVINFDLRLDRSDSIEYIHRISKVGRGTKPGFVVNIVVKHRGSKGLRVVRRLEKFLDIRMIELFERL